jgi:hypothetical protein
MFSELVNNLNQKGLKMERIFGGKGQRDAMAQFCEYNPDLLQLAATFLLYHFSANNTYTDKEFNAYQTGIIEFGKMFDDCLKERMAEMTPPEE